MDLKKTGYPKLLIVKWASDFSRETTIHQITITNICVYLLKQGITYPYTMSWIHIGL